jgi:dolichol-phosphate mannosyltransferase
LKIVSLIAAYDEKENIEALTRRLAAVFASLDGWETGMIFVVAGSDGTREILERLSRESPAIRIVHEEEPGGLGNATRKGFAALPPDADFAVTMDADLNHQPEEIPRLLAAIQASGSDILVGSRFIAGGRIDGTPAWKLLLSGLLNVLMRFVFGLKTKDKTSGFKIYRTAILPLIEWENDNFAFQPEILIRAKRSGLRVTEEPIHFIYRRQGVSKMHFWTTVFSFLSLLKLGFQRRHSSSWGMSVRER